MNGRVFQRIPYAVKVEFRTASSFLVAYSVNLSRGGLFIETDHAAKIGDGIRVDFEVPGLGPVAVTGRVAWRRDAGGTEGPAGVGVEFDDVDELFGRHIDRLVARFKGLRVLILCAREDDGPTLERLVRAALATAAVDSSNDFRQAAPRLTDEVDLAVIELDVYTDLAIDLIRKAKARTPPIPVIALVSEPSLRERARKAGADECVANPPAAAQFQALLLKTLGRPLRVGAPPPPLPGVS
ncbi:TIGR02266 family protein [Haliangium sp.]|uniref:TIGR02266 family protein n=1 Tax=Haliangium sp. TaxID=2663208 RepID=UPI003D150D7B